MEHIESDNPIKKIPKILEPLAEEARKYKTPEEFARAFSIYNMHGRYWHITDDPNFTIKNISPRDLSTMGTGRGARVGLMVTSNPEWWSEHFPERKYIAEIDMSKAIPDKDYKLVDRGFGHEIFIHNLNSVKVKRVYPLKSGLQAYRRYFDALSKYLTCKEDAINFWRLAQEEEKKEHIEA